MLFRLDIAWNLRDRYARWNTLSHDEIGRIGQQLVQQCLPCCAGPIVETLQMRCGVDAIRLNAELRNQLCGHNRQKSEASE